jgi:hypothetical protein
MINHRATYIYAPFLRILFILFIILIPVIYSHGQPYKGYIFNWESKLPVANANIFFEGMYRGTASNDEGYFEITDSVPTGIPLIVTALGYYSTAISRLDGILVNVYLQPKVFDIDEVVVIGNERKGLRRLFDWSEEKKQRVFIREFLGSSPNASRCYIENMKDITLIFDREENTLSAYSEEPIIIINEALGYEIHYFLDHFINTMKTISYKGMYYFIENDIEDENTLTKIQSRRRYTYRGSRMHFIRALWYGALAEEKFIFTNSDINRSASGSVITDSEGLKYLKPLQGTGDTEIEITYIPTESVSSLSCLYDSAYIQSNGYFDPDGILWSGAFARQRVADLLPFDYMPEEK